MAKKYTIFISETESGKIVWSLVRPDGSIAKQMESKPDVVELMNEFNSAYFPEEQ